MLSEFALQITPLRGMKSTRYPNRESEYGIQAVSETPGVSGITHMWPHQRKRWVWGGHRYWDRERKWKKAGEDRKDEREEGKVMGEEEERELLLVGGRKEMFGERIECGKGKAKMVGMRVGECKRKML